MAFVSGTLGLGTGFVNGTLTEPAGSGYARQPITFDSVIGGLSNNTINCVFGPVTTPWGTLTSFMVFDANGNAVFPGTLIAPLVTAVGEVISIPVNNITLNFSATALAATSNGGGGGGATKVSQLLNDSGFTTATQVAAAIATVPLPTKVSQLTNDAGFVTPTDVTTQITTALPTKISQLTNDAGYVTPLAVTAQISASVPSKVSQLLNDSNFVTPAGVTTIVGPQITAVTNSLPTKVSQLTNDSGFTTAATVTTQIAAAVPTKVSQLTNDSQYLTQANVAQAAGVPTKVSQLTNDTGYVTPTAVSSQITAALPTKVSQLTNDSSFATTAAVTTQIAAAVPTKVSQLTNDSNFAATSAVPTKVSQLTNDSSFATSTAVTTQITAAVPTKVSQLTNDSSFAVTSALPTKVSQLTNDSSFTTSAAVTTQIAAAVPTKVSQLTNDSNFAAISIVPTKVSQLTNDSSFATSTAVTTQITAAVPTKVSQLTNDSSFTTSAAVTTQITAAVPTKVSQLTNDSNFAATSTVPTKVSQLTNDSSFVTSAAIVPALAPGLTVGGTGNATAPLATFDAGGFGFTATPQQLVHRTAAQTFTGTTENFSDANRAALLTGSWTGTPVHAGQIAVYSIQYSDNCGFAGGVVGNTGNANGMTTLSVVSNYTTGWGGGRQGVSVQMKDSGPPGPNGDGNYAAQMVAANLNVVANHSFGPPSAVSTPTPASPLPSDYAGNYYGTVGAVNPAIYANAGAVRLASIGNEVDVGVLVPNAADAPWEVFAFSFVHTEFHANRGLVTDAVFKVADTSSAVATWRTVMQVGGDLGKWPLGPDSTIIGAYQSRRYGRLVLPPVAFSALDVRQVNFGSGLPLATPGFSVTPTGGVASGTALLSTAASGTVTLDVPNVQVTTIAVVFAQRGGGFHDGDLVYGPYGGQYTVTTNGSGNVASLAILNPDVAPATAVPANPVSLTGGNGVGLGVTLTWTGPAALQLNPAGGKVTVPVPAQLANDNQATTTSWVAAAVSTATAPLATTAALAAYVPAASLPATIAALAPLQGFITGNTTLTSAMSGTIFTVETICTISGTYASLGSGFVAEFYNDTGGNIVFSGMSNVDGASQLLPGGVAQVKTYARQGGGGVIVWSGSRTA